MSVLRLVVVLMLAAGFGVALAEIVRNDVDPMQTRSAMNLCDSGGRRPCP
ncbi:hypothetical protein RB623_16115 [Mesorhizobium sp. LHD-90]|nr:hypothetical protein [Mesorhizobium sp. LHD-90]MDQ6435584.1 hypothetical protein [Mesorhizobium sp. LHD-90]